MAARSSRGIGAGSGRPGGMTITRRDETPEERELNERISQTLQDVRARGEALLAAETRGTSPESEE